MPGRVVPVGGQLLVPSGQGGSPPPFKICFKVLFLPKTNRNFIQMVIFRFLFNVSQYALCIICCVLSCDSDH